MVERGWKRALEVQLQNLTQEIEMSTSSRVSFVPSFAWRYPNETRWYEVTGRNEQSQSTSSGDRGGVMGVTKWRESFMLSRTRIQIRAPLKQFRIKFSSCIGAENIQQRYIVFMSEIL